MAASAVMGISMGVAFTVVCALIADVVPREMRGLTMGCCNARVYAGMMLCSVGMGMVIKGEGFRVGFFLSGAVGVIVLLLFRFLFRRQPAIGRKK